MSLSYLPALLELHEDHDSKLDVELDIAERATVRGIKRQARHPQRLPSPALSVLWNLLLPTVTPPPPPPPDYFCDDDDTLLDLTLPSAWTTKNGSERSSSANTKKSNGPSMRRNIALMIFSYLAILAVVLYLQLNGIIPRRFGFGA